MKNKKKMLAIFIIVIGIALLGAGGVIVYQNNANKNKILTSFKNFSSTIEKTLSIDTNDENTYEKITASGKMNIAINPMIKEMAGDASILIDKINSSTINYEYKTDLTSKQMILNGSLLLNNSEILSANYYQKNDIGYLFLKNIFDKYLKIDNFNIFGSLEDSEKAVEDMNYIYDKVIKSLEKNINNKDIKVSKVKLEKESSKKISLELDQKRLIELKENVVKDLKKDKKAKEILNDYFDMLDSLNESEDEVKVVYNIYLIKGKIVKYEFGAKDSEDYITMSFNDKDEKSVEFANNGELIYKGIIENSNNTINIKLVNKDNNNMGNININDNSTTINLTVDADLETKVLFNFDNTKNANNITTNIKISMITNGTTIDFITINDNKTITENVADFTNIDTTNNINVNDLTEEDYTNMQNNFLKIIYSYLGINI